jgi:hypothetical protein
MASRSNKTARSMAAQVNAPATVKPSPRTYGAPTGYAPPSRAMAAGRPQVGPGTQTQRRAAIVADQAAATAGAKKFAAKRVTRQAQQSGSPQKVNLSAIGAANTIREKKARDLETIDRMSK